MYKGALEDPALAREMSPTGFTVDEELQAFTGDLLGNLLHSHMRASFEEPHGGWGDPIQIIRPKYEELKRKTREKEKEEAPDWRRLADFTNAIHEEAMRGN